MRGKLRPDAVASSVHEVDYARLRQLGITALVFDLDNTLCCWRAGPPDRATLALLARLKQGGFQIAVLSNGRLDRRPAVPEAFAQLEVPLIWPAGKPAGRGIRRALAAAGARPHQAAMIGDQLLTDVLGGNLAGLYTVLVPPLCPGQEHPFTRANRWLERLLGRR
ncbi:MAG: YqeG family HAD IIIA-type phosphatase [Candidatus Bipolaricaulaceae bacterium]